MKSAPKWKATEGMELLKLKSLVYDQELYPRMQVDYDHVQRIVDAMEAGVLFPPIIVCKATRRIVDGYHRTKAVERITNGIGEIACICKTYKTREDFFLDAVRYNSEHGLALSAKDRFKILELAEGLKISPTRTAEALRMSVSAAGKLSVKPVQSLIQVRQPFPPVRPRFIEPPAARPQTVTLAETTTDEPLLESPEETGGEAAFVPDAPFRGGPSTYRAIESAKVLIDYLEGEAIDYENDQFLTAMKRIQELLEALELPAMTA